MMKKEVKNKSIRRLKIIEGQVRGLQKMVKEERYCIDIIRQSLAVKKALSAVENGIFENHLKTHAAAQFKGGRKDKAAKEIIEIYRLSKEK